MKRYYLLLTLCCFSCKNSVQNQNTHIKKPMMSTVKKHSHLVELEHISKVKISDWKEYVSVGDNLKKFSSISANEALNNALQLSGLIKQMKDSIKPKELMNPSFRTRVDVLDSEALRLKDMTYISSITSKEVNLQVDKIMDAFSATNSKINTVYSQLEVEKEIQINNKPINSTKTKVN